MIARTRGDDDETADRHRNCRHAHADLSRLDPGRRHTSGGRAGADRRNAGRLARPVAWPHLLGAERRRGPAREQCRGGEDRGRAGRRQRKGYRRRDRALLPQAGLGKTFGLLAGHWGAIRAYLDATQAGDKSGQDAAFDKLVGNAGEISTFLGGANPHLPVDTLRGLLTAHGGHHVDQIKQLKAGEYDQEARTCAAMKDHIYVIADELANGIAKQFPDKFR